MWSSVIRESFLVIRRVVLSWVMWGQWPEGVQYFGLEEYAGTLLSLVKEILRRTNNKIKSDS